MRSDCGASRDLFRSPGGTHTLDLGQDGVVVAEVARLARHPTAMDRCAARQHVVDPGAVVCRDSGAIPGWFGEALAQPAKDASSGESIDALRSPSRTAAGAAPTAATVASACSSRSPEPIWLKWAVPKARPANSATSRQRGSRMWSGASAYRMPAAR